MPTKRSAASGDENARALNHKKKQMIEQMAIAGAFSGFNDLGRSVTPSFLLMDHFLT